MVYMAANGLYGVGVAMWDKSEKVYKCPMCL